MIMVWNSTFCFNLRTAQWPLNAVNISPTWKFSVTSYWIVWHISELLFSIDHSWFNFWQLTCSLICLWPFRIIADFIKILLVAFAEFCMYSATVYIVFRASLNDESLEQIPIRKEGKESLPDFPSLLVTMTRRFMKLSKRPLETHTNIITENIKKETLNARATFSLFWHIIYCRMLNT